MEEAESCVFCMVADGRIQAKVVLEDEEIVAFDDIAPQAPVHVLIVPRRHFEHLGDGLPPELVARLFLAVPEVARRKGIDESGYRVIVNSGRDGAQTVKHLHVHVLGGAAMAEGMVRLAGG